MSQKNTTPSECHILPCHIAYTGSAPVSLYFSPQVAPTDKETTKTTTVRAAQFRGRGLLAAEQDGSNNNTRIHGRVLSVQSKQQLTTTDTFSHVCEWFHQHDPKALEQPPESVFDKATEWLEVAHALHTPIDIPSKKTTTTTQQVSA